MTDEKLPEKYPILDFHFYRKMLLEKIPAAATMPMIA
jgi:hypothetical protein